MVASRRETDEVELRDGRFEVLRQDRRVLDRPQRGPDFIIEEAEATQVDLVAGRRNDVIGCDESLPAVAARQAQLDPAVAIFRAA